MLPQIPLLNQNYKPLLTVTLKKKEEPKPTEPTLDEKIASNYYTCTNLQWIRADNATCLDKPLVIVETPSGSSAVYTGGSGNTYFAGQCTAYVKDMVGWVRNGWGNASDWKYTSGHRVSATPTVGAVAWAKGYGHVALVTGVGNGTVTVSEQNYRGPFIVSSRVAPSSEFEYIYP